MGYGQFRVRDTPGRTGGIGAKTMREYRGKRVDNLEWVEGWYVKEKVVVEDGGIESVHTITTAEQANDVHDFSKFIVIPSTVGQDTGLKDKNGRKIFEGDKVRWFNSSCVIRFDDGETMCFWLDCNSMGYELKRGEIYEVTGTIHDKETP